MSTWTQTVTINATPGDAMKAAESIAAAHRAQGRAVIIGTEYEQQTGHKAGLLSVDLLIEDAPEPASTSGTGVNIPPVFSSFAGEPVPSTAPEPAPEDIPLIVAAAPDPEEDAMSASLAADDVDLSLGPDATTEDSEMLPTSDPTVRKRRPRSRPPRKQG